MSRAGGRSRRAREDLVVARLDELAPSLEDLSRLLRRMGDQGVRLRFRTGEATTSEAESRLLAQGILLAAEFQARVTAARLREAVVRARTEGRFPTGRPRTLSAERVAELRAQGLGATAIARELGVARASVYRKLREIEAPETRRRRGSRQPLVR